MEKIQYMVYCSAITVESDLEQRLSKINLNITAA